MSEQPSRERRAALLRLGALCGVALAGDVLAAVAAGGSANKRPGAQPELLSAGELALTGVLAELIIPQTDTPGALAVGAHYTVDHLLRACVPEREQVSTRALLPKLDGVAQREAGKPFVALPAARQTALLHALDDGTSPFDANDQRAFRHLKGLVAFAYYTSEAGATQELAYLPFPGGFTGNVRIQPTTRTWAL